MEEGALFKDFVKGAYGLTFIVCISRIWDHYTIDKSKYFGINFVMVDRKGGVIEGVIPPEFAEQFRKRIREGSVYKIQHYLIERPKNTYKAADHPHRLSFIKTTVVTPIIPQPMDFPLIAHNALPLSELEKRIGSKVLLSDTVGLMVSVTDLLPPSGTAKESRRQITITDGQKKATVTLWGEFAQQFDADNLRILSKREPIVIMFVGILVDQYAGTLALKSTSCTRWHVNVDIPEMKAVLDRVKNQPYEIEVRSSGQARQEKVETTISAFKGVDPATTLNTLFKFRVKITQVVSLTDWMYMGCKICWKGLRTPGGGLRSCPNCPDGGEPWPRYKIRVHAIDDGSNDEESATFAEFLFFGALGEQIAGITADCASANKTGRIDYLPPKLEQLPGKRFILTAVTKEDSLKSDFYKFQVRAVEHVQNEEPIPALPMLNTATIPATSEPANTKAITTPATSEHNKGESLSPNMKDGKSQDDTSTSQHRKRSDSKDELSTSDSKKRHVAKQLFTAVDDQEKAENVEPK